MAYAGFAVALAWAVGAIVAVDPGASQPTTYAAELPLARVAEAVAGVGLILAGGLACTQSRARRLGVLSLLAGVAWFGADWEGAEDAPVLLRSMGALAAPLSLAFVFHLALALPAGRLTSSAARLAVAVTYVLAATATVGRALVLDPLLDLYCWRNCTDTAFLVHADQSLARTLGDLWLGAAIAIGLGVVAFAAHRALTATPPARRAAMPLLAPAALVGAAEAVYAFALLDTPMEDPARVGFATIFVARCAAYAALAVGLTWTVVRVPRTRARVASVAGELGAAPPPGRLREALAEALGDPQVDVRYRRAGSDELIDAEGHPAPPPPPGRAVARIIRRGRPLALVLHDPALVDEPELERALGSAARLAVENEVLRAEALAQVRELRASRARIVEASDAARRRLERNLHDGAQQRLLALSFDLRVAKAAATRDGDEQRVALLDAAGRETGVALEELRVLAHGIYPAILAEAGLAPALETLADEAPLPVELDGVEQTRLPPAVETTAYVAVAEAIEDAHRRGASFLAARVALDGVRLTVTADDDGRAGGPAPENLADRIGALGGSLTVDETGLRAEIPCG